MAMITRYYGKWQVQIRRVNHPSQTQSFILKKNAEEWARKIEIQIQHVNFGIKRKNFPVFKEIILKYINEVSYLKNMMSHN